MTYDSEKEDIFNSLYLAYSGDNIRQKDVYILNNTFYDMPNAAKTLIDVQAYSFGSVYFSGNLVRNCSSIQELINLVANQDLIVDSNIFDQLSAYSRSILRTGFAQRVHLNQLQMSNFVHSSITSSVSLLFISSTVDGNATFENSIFHGNNIKSDFITFGENVGSLSFVNNEFHEDIIKAGKVYITTVNLFLLEMTNCTFYNMDDDSSADLKTDILKISNIDLSTLGNYTLDNMSFRNVSMQFLTVGGVSGTPIQKKFMTIRNTVFSDSILVRSNVFMKFGPILTTRDIQFLIDNFDVRDLVLEKGGFIMDVHYQGPNPFIIENSYFTNIKGGYMRVRARSTSLSTNYATLRMENVNVVN